MRNLLKKIVILISSLLLVECNNPSYKEVVLSIKEDNVSCYIGIGYSLEYQVENLDDTYTFSSSDSTIATISNLGEINPLKIGECTITLKADHKDYIDTCKVIVNDLTPTTKFSVNASNFDDYGSYYDGNYGRKRVRSNTISKDFSYYRIAKSTKYNDAMFKMIPYLLNDDNSLSGSFFNENYFPGISKIDITYLSQDWLILEYGTNRNRDNSYIFPKSEDEFITTSFKLNNLAAYFKISCIEEEVYIKNIDIYCNDALKDDTSFKEVENARINPKVYQGELINGESSITIDNKTYIYYSPSYVFEHKNELDLSSIAMTEPIDVANYFIAFNSLPANYGGTISYIECLSVSTINSLFGKSARKVSEYSRTDGYSKCVPYNPHLGTNKPLYLELDIDVDNTYTTSDRGVGRIVMFVDGLKCYNDTNPVGFYTDDHSQTFKEYLNNSSWGQRFDTLDDNCHVTNYNFHSH